VTSTCEACGKTVVALVKRKFCDKKCEKEYKRGRPVGAYGRTRSIKVAATKLAKHLEIFLAKEAEIQEILSHRYVSSLTYLAEKVGVVVNKRLDAERRYPKHYVKKYLEGFIMKNPTLATDWTATPAYPLAIQQLDVGSFEKLCHDLEHELIGRVAKKWKIYNSVLRRFASLRGLNLKKYFPHEHFTTVSMPENLFEAILVDLKVPYQKQVKIDRTDNGSYYVIDFVVGGTIAVEVQGDYWHANPALFKDDALNEMQVTNRARDVLKGILCKKVYHTFLAVWEKDLKSTKGYEEIRMDLQRRLHEQNYNNR